MFSLPHIIVFYEKISLADGNERQTPRDLALAHRKTEKAAVIWRFWTKRETEVEGILFLKVFDGVLAAVTHGTCLVCAGAVLGPLSSLTLSSPRYLLCRDPGV